MSQPNEKRTLPPRLRDLVKLELRQGEKVLWFGQPVVWFSQGPVAFGYFQFPIFITILAGIFIDRLPVADGALSFFGAFTIWCLLFGLTVLCGILLMRRDLKNTVYVITDQRAIIFVRYYYVTRIVSFTPQELGEIQCKEKENGIGDVFVSDSKRNTWRTGALEQIPTNRFLDLDILEAKKVERLLKKLAAQTTNQTTKKPQATEQVDDLPILQQLTSVPRSLPFSVQLHLRLCSPTFGWLLAGGGFLFALVATVFAGGSGDDIGVALVPMIAGALCGAIGLYFPIYAWFTAGKTIRLLRNGTATKAKFLGLDSADAKVGGSPMMKMNFEYQVDGETYPVSTKALDTSHLTDTKSTVVFYDPMSPDRSVVLETLPQGIRLDELTGRFRTNPLRFAFPILAATVVCGEIVMIVMVMASILAR